MPDITPHFAGKEGEHREYWSLQEISQESINYIKDVVWRMLNTRKPENIERLAFFKDACSDKELTNVDIFTLNHDMVLESYLSQNNIGINDGFLDPDASGVKYWSHDLFKESSCKVSLFKLHGSLNWFRLRSIKDNVTIDRIGIPPDWDYQHTKDKNGNDMNSIKGRPEFLVGTFNKMFEYSSSIYAELHCQFYQILKDIDSLIICGYGFGDKGINKRIFEWVYSSLSHKIIIIDAAPKEDLLKRARGVLAGNWDDLARQNILVYIDKGIENVSWQEIKDALS